MDTNIFKNARFGDRFLTADGRKAVFLYFWGNPRSCAFLFIEKWDKEEYQLNGMMAGHTKPCGWDIVKQCRADGWEPLPTERERLTMELNATREMLANGCDDLLMRTSLENRIKMLEEELAGMEE